MQLRVCISNLVYPFRLHITVRALTNLRAAQSSTYYTQDHNYIPASQQSTHVSPQQRSTHLKSPTWNPTSDVYDPYKPNSATNQSSFHSSSTQSTYDPYKHPATLNTPTQSTYDPYKPHTQHIPAQDPYKPNAQTNSSAQSRPTPAYGRVDNNPSAYSKPPAPPVPVPPRVTAESFRTNTSNAYDPPMLPTKTKRHASGWGPTMTSPLHTSSLPSPPIVSNTPLALPPRRDSPSTGSPARADPSLVGPPHRIHSPAHQSSVKPSSLPPPTSRPSSRQVLRGTSASHPPPPLPSSRQDLPGPPVQDPQRHSYTTRRVDSPGLGTSNNWTPTPEHTTMNSDDLPAKTIPRPEQPPTKKDHGVSFDDFGDPEALGMDAEEVPPATDAEASPGLLWDREGGPSPSTARQPDPTTPKNDEIDDTTIVDIPKPEVQPASSPHSRAGSYDRSRVNDKLASPPKPTAPSYNSYKSTNPAPQHPPSANQSFPTSTQVTSISYDPYRPSVSSTPGSVPVSTPSSPVKGSRPGSLRSSLESTRPQIAQYDYTPPVRSSSPASIRSQPGTYVSSALKSEYTPPSYDPYAPANRTRSATNGTISSVTSDTYVPLRQPNEAQDHAPYGSKFVYPDRPSSRTDSLVSSAYQTYAPSPSLLGTNDPLGRSSARVPVISFGFGGKVVTCFHGADMSSAGFDVALSSRQSRDIHVRSLHKLVPQLALEDTSVVYPGPLFGDSGSPTVSLVRATSAQAKTKKAKVLKYLEERISELMHVITYASTGLLERGRSEGKLALFGLLKVLVENDGKLNGT